nr:TrkA C-terminal domain-containing protein [Cohnella lubricantis]
MELLLREKKELDRKFESLLAGIVEASDRLKNLKPYHPVEIKIGENSPVAGMTIGALQFWQNTGATIIALRRGTNVFISPGPHVVLGSGDVLVVVGDDSVYLRTERFINGAEE